MDDKFRSFDDRFLKILTRTDTTNCERYSKERRQKRDMCKDNLEIHVYTKSLIRICKQFFPPRPSFLFAVYY